jgi:alpha-beta hydrolase superfamily lysophospholipase
VVRFTAERRDFTFEDTDGVQVSYYAWTPGRPKAVVQVLHGLGEHALRYEELAQELVNAGYSVYADDHRGHGATGLAQWQSDTTKLGKLGPGGQHATMRAIRQLTSRIRREHPGLPIVLLGHSWGSLLAQILVNKHAEDYDALVLTGTAYRLPGYMNGGALNKRHAHLGTTGFEWLSRDPEVARRFAEDPLCFDANARKLFGYREALRLVGLPKRLTKDLPVLIAIGSDDALGGEASIRKLAASYLKRARASDVTAIIYPDARHEIFNETNRAEVFADLIEWLDNRFGKTPPPG